MASPLSPSALDVANVPLCTDGHRSDCPLALLLLLLPSQLIFPLIWHFN